ncbi:unnamed protein product [Strongylus vulgaris]|uniref:Uncharacterized protein n=1 Tax=Strongylus vulgaris TaxID=40348 RepID=A0A3P7KTY5_STRVU|nr:unnamed protein product [Strongylus vulgaris]
MSRLRDPAEHQWVDIMRRTDDRWTLRTLEWMPCEAKRPRRRPPTIWVDVFVVGVEQLNSQFVTSHGSRPRERRRHSLIPTSWMTLAKDKNEWKQRWGLHDD